MVTSHIMDTDITPIPYVVLVTRIIERCYSDWTHFCLRVRKDGSANSSRFRVALAQFCRNQRELFLKLRTLHPFVRPQTQGALNRLLQDSVTAQQIMPNIINFINQTLWSTRESLLQMGLMAPPPNLSAAVDVLATNNYTRLPVLLDQTIKMADTGDIQLIDYGISEFDTVKRRLDDEYLISFKRSSVPKDRVELVYKNGHVDFVVKGYFCVSVIYDLTRWQVLDAVLNIAEEMNIQSTGLLKDSFLQLIDTTVASTYNVCDTRDINAADIQVDNDVSYGSAANGKKCSSLDANIFEIIYTVGMRYCIKLKLEHLYEQAINYKSNSNRVSDVKFTCQNIPIVTCSNVFTGIISLEIEINRVPLCIDTSDYESLEILFQRINIMTFSFDIDNGTNEFYETKFPFKISIKGLPNDLNTKCLNNYVNKCGVETFQLHYWINYFYYSLETLMLELLKNIFNGSMSSLATTQIQSVNIATLSIYDQGQYLGCVSLSRFTGNILFRVKNNFNRLSKLTKKLIASECAASIDAFKSLLYLIVGINKLDNYKNPTIISSKRIYPIHDDSMIDMLERLFNGRMIYGELKETDATEALLFDCKCYKISNVVFALYSNENQLFALACKQLQPPELLNL